MRRFYLSTEYWTTLALVLFLASFGWARVHEQTLTILISLVIDSYAIGRTLWKRNRGQFYSALRSSEFHLLLLAHLWTVCAWKWHALGAVEAAIALGVNQAVYNCCRGVTKGLGVKTQMIVT